MTDNNSYSAGQQNGTFQQGMDTYSYNQGQQQRQRDEQFRRNQESAAQQRAQQQQAEDNKRRDVLFKSNPNVTNSNSNAHLQVEDAPESFIFLAAIGFIVGAVSGLGYFGFDYYQAGELGFNSSLLALAVMAIVCGIGGWIVGYLVLPVFYLSMVGGGLWLIFYLLEFFGVV